MARTFLPPPLPIQKSGTTQLPIKANLLACLAVFHRVLDLDPHSLRFHKEDERTTHRTCPGKNLNKAQLIEDLVARLSPRPSDLSPLV